MYLVRTEPWARRNLALALLLLVACGGRSPRGSSPAARAVYEGSGGESSTASRDEAELSLPPCAAPQEQEFIVLRLEPRGDELEDSTGYRVELRDRGELEAELTDRRELAPEERVLFVVAADEIDRARLRDTLAVARGLGFQASGCTRIDLPAEPQWIEEDEGLGTLHESGDPDPSVRDYGSGGGLDAHVRGIPRVNVTVSSARGLPRDVARRVLRLHRHEVRSCYERGLDAESTLAGTLTIELALSATGVVTSVRMRDTDLGAESVQDCIRQLHHRWRFPMESPGGVTIVWELSG